jgi:glutamate--cysteine ligase
LTEAQHSFQTNLNAISSGDFAEALKGIKHGVEREALRVNADGGIATDKHPDALGSALTHEYITTDFSESLLEFITPPETSYKKSIAQLSDIHKFTYDAIGEQYLWPISMPCFINAETNIPIAQYGRSNIAKMKEVYRQGLHNRYGSMMQVIAGVHFNFSLSDEFWQQWCKHNGQQWNKTTQSAHYFSLVRNFRRYAWVIPYLFGASPALCSSFISHRDVPHKFSKVGRGTYYLPYATSLRMSDLGYTSSAQANLQICYNDLSSYVASVRSAISQKAPSYSHIPSNQDDGWEQLNDNVLQIENELYSPIRPKQIAKSLEMPTNALEDRGVSYLEVRSLDVNPYSAIGVDASQFHFLDVFLLYCLLEPSPALDRPSFETCQDNVNKTVLEGRDPKLTLNNNGEQVLLSEWGTALCEKLMLVAATLDAANDVSLYSKAVQEQAAKFANSELTPSGKWLRTLLDNQIDNSALGLELAKVYKQNAANLTYSEISFDDFVNQAASSIKGQREIEANDDVDFSTFVNEYFDKRVSV